MKVSSLKDFKNGWIVGNFEPSLVSTEDLDIGILYCKEGEEGDGHYHKRHTEYNIVVEGSAEVDNRILNTGDIFIYEPYDKSYVKYLKDTKLVVIKIPATKNDKYYEPIK